MPTKRATIRGPYHGIITDQPPTVDEQGFEDVVNFLMRKGRIINRPGLNMASKFLIPNNEFPQNLTSFKDIENFFHTVLLTSLNAYMYSGGNFHVLTYPVFIKTLTLSATGSGYQVGDILGVIQSGAANGTAFVTQTANNAVVSITSITAGGSGYSIGDVLSLVGGSGSGATFRVTALSGTAVSAGTLTTGGNGYTAGGVTSSGGTGSGATFNVTVGPSGQIVQLGLDNPGQGYTTATGLSTSGGSGTGATVNITTSTISSLGGATSTGLPFAVVKAQNRVYFCNGSIPLCFIDGEASFKLAGNVPGSCRFLTANASHLLGAYWTEPDPTQPGSIVYPRRVRWSDVNNYDEWNEAYPGVDSGLADITDTPDDITGLSTVGYNSHIYRTNGISIARPTGSSTEPFVINNFSDAPKGEGCQYPYSLSTYNNVDRFIGNYDVYAFDGSNFSPLMDQKCNGKFFSDLQGAVGTVRGFTTPVLDNGFTYLGYVITIPGTNVAWILNIVEGSWTRMKWSLQGTVGFSDLQFIEQVYLS